MEQIFAVELLAVCLSHCDDVLLSFKYFNLKNNYKDYLSLSENMFNF